MTNASIPLTRESTIGDLIKVLQVERLQDGLSKADKGVLTATIHRLSHEANQRFATLGDMADHRSKLSLCHLSGKGRDNVMYLLKEHNIVRPLTSASSMNDLAEALLEADDTTEKQKRNTAIAHTLKFDCKDGLKGMRGKVYMTLGDIIADEANAKLALSTLPNIGRVSTTVIFDFLKSHGIASQQQLG